MDIIFHLAVWNYQHLQYGKRQDVFLKREVALSVMAVWNRVVMGFLLQCLQ